MDPMNMANSWTFFMAVAGSGIAIAAAVLVLSCALADLCASRTRTGGDSR